MAEKNLNRIKVMLAEKGKTNKWLAEKLGRDQATISKRPSNHFQMVYQCLSTTFRSINTDSSMSGS